MRYWTSWYTEAEEDPDELPFSVWCTGGTMSFDDEPCQFTMCAVLDVEAFGEIEPIVKSFYPDAEMRFISPRTPDWVPPEDRFPQQTSCK